MKTPEEFAAEFSDLEHGNYAYAKGDLVGADGSLTAAFREVVAAEREACAATLEAMCGTGDECAKACARCRGLRRGAEEIRARGK